MGGTHGKIRDDAAAAATKDAGGGTTHKPPPTNCIDLAVSKAAPAAAAAAAAASASARTPAHVTPSASARASALALARRRREDHARPFASFISYPHGATTSSPFASGTTTDTPSKAAAAAAAAVAATKRRKKRPLDNCSVDDDSDDDDEEEEDASSYTPPNCKRKKAKTNPDDKHGGIGGGGDDGEKKEDEGGGISMEQKVRWLLHGKLAGLRCPADVETTRSASIARAFALLSDMLWSAETEKEEKKDVNAERPDANGRGSVGSGADNLSALVDLMDQYDGCGTALTVLKMHPGSASVLEEGFCFLTDYTVACPSAAGKVVCCFGLQVIVRAMRRFPDSEDLQLRAVEALVNVLGQTTTLGKVVFVRDFRGLPPVVRAMTRYPDNAVLQERAVALLRRICRIEELRPALVRAGALSRVVAAAERHGAEAGGKVQHDGPAGGDAAAETTTNDIQREAKTIVEQLGPLLL
jgi:hypothetical protein